MHHSAYADLVAIDASHLRPPDPPGLRQLFQGIVGDETGIDSMERFQEPVHHPPHPLRHPGETLQRAAVRPCFGVVNNRLNAQNAFALLYLVQITLSAVVLRKVWTWALGVLSKVCFGLLFFFHAPSAEFKTLHVEQGLSPHLVGMWIAFVTAAALITFFTGKIADTLRTREQEVLVLQDQVAKNERLASLVTLAAGAANELGTPLGTIAVVARELERYTANCTRDDAVLEDARLIRSGVDRCRRILEQMSLQSAEPMGETPGRIQVHELFVTVIEQFPESQRALLKIELADETLAAILPRKATVQMLAALIQNALDANVDHRPILLTAMGKDSELRIAVRDSGHGMPGNVLRRIAEPFFTTKEPGKGMGLGTFLVRTFAERLGGRVLFDSIPGEGTTVTLELPLHSLRRNASCAIPCSPCRAAQRFAGFASGWPADSGPADRPPRPQLL